MMTYVRFRKRRTKSVVPKSVCGSVLCGSIHFCGIYILIYILYFNCKKNVPFFYYFVCRQVPLEFVIK